MRLRPALVAASIGLCVAVSCLPLKAAEKKGSGAIPAAAMPWVTVGEMARARGDLPAARNAYETALLLAPGEASIYFALAQIARAEKMPGRAIKYFDDVLRLDPQNQTALRDSGLTMMDKGAVESARQTLGQLKALCKTKCAIADPLVAAIAAGPPKVQKTDVAETAKAADVK